MRIEDELVGQKRDVKGMNETVRTVQSGQRVEAKIFHDQFGVFKVSGNLRRSESTESFVLAGVIVESGNKVDKSVFSLNVSSRSVSPDGSNSTRDGQLQDDLDGLDETVASLNHGDLVEAMFESAPYGQFCVAGVVVQAPTTNALFVGTWIIRNRDDPAPRVRQLDVIKTVGNHKVLAPPRPATWSNSGSGSSTL